ncbi:MAG: winged helix-turn-helix domain-containing protein [Eubacteriales bacterium]|nr:winged helix-turn-helix domain-containing protein [Eubacteriales bacterium]
MLLVSFEDDDEKIINSVISVLDAGREKYTFQEINLKRELHHNGIVIGLERREVIKNNKKIGLTYTEFEILQFLAQNPGRVFSKEQIYDVVWKEPYVGDYNIVMSHISHIREKIEDDPAHPVYIQTVWGVGYKFNGRANAE